MICPIMSKPENSCARPNEYCDCEKEGCAWWDEDEKHCCIKTLAMMQTIQVQM